jgi:hypothetical protein
VPLREARQCRRPSGGWVRQLDANCFLELHPRWLRAMSESNGRRM